MGSKRKKFDSNTLEDIQLREHNYETSLDLTGYGKFTYTVLSACAIGLLAVGFQNGVTAYLLPSVKCDLKISSKQMGLINVAFMIGGILSACVLGLAADMMGRRKILFLTFTADSLVTILSALSQNYSMLLVMRFFNGFLIGGPGYLLFTYLGDMIPLKLRTKYICYIGFNFILSWILLPALAFLIMPLRFHITLPGYMVFNSWRLYLLLCSVPSITSSFLFYTLPESPRLLLANKRTKEAMDVLKSIFNINTGRPDKEYLVIHTLHCSKKSNEIQLNQMCIDLKGGKISRLLRDIVEHVTALFRSPYTLKSLIVMFIFFANMFGCYGFGLWIPELLSRFRKHSDPNGNDGITVCELSKNKAILVTHNQTNSSIYYGNTTGYVNMDFDYYDGMESLQKSFNCDGRMDYQGFKDTMTIGLACLVYNMISVTLSSVTSVHVLSVLSLSIAGVAALTFPWVGTPGYCLIAASFFQAPMITANIVIVGLVMDAFPANISSMAVCIATLAGRLGSICSNLFFGAFMDFSCQIPIFLVAALSIGGALLVFFVGRNTTEDTNTILETVENKMETNTYKEFAHIELNQISEHM